MEMPKYFGLVRTLAQIGAALGCLFGVILAFASIVAFEFGMLPGIYAILVGVWLVLGSLASLGVVYCFLAMVKAQIDTRNAVVGYINRTGSVNPLA